MTTATKYHRSGSKYKTHPGLTISNRELRERVKNRSIQISLTGKQYSDSIETDRILKSNTAENHRQWLKQNRDIENLQKSIEKANIYADKKPEIKKPEPPKTETNG